MPSEITPTVTPEPSTPKVDLTALNPRRASRAVSLDPTSTLPYRGGATAATRSRPASLRRALIGTLAWTMPRA